MVVRSLTHLRHILYHFRRSWVYNTPGKSYIILDTETEGIPYKGVSSKKDALVLGRARILAISMAYQGASYSMLTCFANPKAPTPKDWLDVLKSVLMDSGVTKVFHNANYDVNVIGLVLRTINIPNVWCTMIGAWMANPGIEKSLKSRAPIYGRYLHQTRAIDFNDDKDLAEYAEQDVVMTEELFQAQIVGKVSRPAVIRYVDDLGEVQCQTNSMADVPVDLPESEKLGAFEKNFIAIQEIPVLRATIRAEQAGVPVDMLKLKSIRKRLAKDKTKVARRLFKAMGQTDINLNSGAQVGKMLVQHGVTLPLTKMGQYKTDVHTLAKISHPLVRQLLQYRQLIKMESVYVGEEGSDELGYESYVSQDGCIHPTLNTVAAVTGRFGASNPNLMQVPSRKDIYGIRKCFSAVPR